MLYSTPPVCFQACLSVYTVANAKTNAYTTTTASSSLFLNSSNLSLGDAALCCQSCHGITTSLYPDACSRVLRSRVRPVSSVGKLTKQCEGPSASITTAAPSAAVARTSTRSSTRGSSSSMEISGNSDAAASDTCCFYRVGRGGESMSAHVHTVHRQSTAYTDSQQHTQTVNSMHIQHGPHLSLEYGQIPILPYRPGIIMCFGQCDVMCLCTHCI